MLILDCQLEIETRPISEILFALPDERGHPSNPEVGTPLKPRGDTPQTPWGHPSNPVGTPLKPRGDTPPRASFARLGVGGAYCPSVNKNILIIPNAKPNIFFWVSDSPSNVTPISTVNKLINTLPIGST